MSERATSRSSVEGIAPWRTGQHGLPPLALCKMVRQRQTLRPRKSRSSALQYVRCQGSSHDRASALMGNTHDPARKPTTWNALVTVCLLEHNWMRPHRALREHVKGWRRYRPRTPAMNLTDQIGSCVEAIQNARFRPVNLDSIALRLIAGSLKHNQRACSPAQSKPKCRLR